MCAGPQFGFDGWNFDDIKRLMNEFRRLWGAEARPNDCAHCMRCGKQGTRGSMSLARIQGLPMLVAVCNTSCSVRSGLEALGGYPVQAALEAIADGKSHSDFVDPIYCDSTRPCNCDQEFARQTLERLGLREKKRA